jgi:hypothetical protein
MPSTDVIIMSESEKNPVLYVHEGIEVRKENKITMRVNDEEMKRLINMHVASKKLLSIPKIIIMLSQPCESCGHNNVSINISKGPLSTKRSYSGGTISSQKSKDVR